MAGNCVALGSVIFMLPGLCFFRKGSSRPVSGSTARSFLVTMPVTLLTGASFSWPAFQERATASPKSKPSTASVKSLMKLRRRNSPSVKISKPSSFCLARTRSMSRSSIECRRWGSCAAVRRASSSSAGRRKLPTWSARYGADMFLLLFTPRLDPELLVDRQAVGAAVAEVVVDEPENVERVEQHVVVIVKLEGAVQEENCFHAVGIVGDQGVNHAGIFADVTAGAGDPIVFQITPGPFQRAGGDGAAMAVAAEPTAFFNPEDVGEGIGAHIKSEMANENIFLERHVGRFVFCGADVNVGAAVFLYDRRETAFCINDGHVCLRRRLRAICDSRGGDASAVRGASIHPGARTAIRLADVRPIFAPTLAARRLREVLTRFPMPAMRAAIGDVQAGAATAVSSGLSSDLLDAMFAVAPSVGREETP